MQMNLYREIVMFALDRDYNVVGVPSPIIELQTDPQNAAITMSPSLLSLCWRQSYGAFTPWQDSMDLGCPKLYSAVATPH